MPDNRRGGGEGPDDARKESLPGGGGWRKVVFACECDDDGNCPRCGIDFAECGCPGPTQDDEYEYLEDASGILWSRRLASSDPSGV